MTIKKLNSSGFTLIELMIVMSVLGILALLAVPEFGRYKKNMATRYASSEIMDNMRLARTMAMKESRDYIMIFDTLNSRYMIGFDGDNDDNLTTLNQDTFGTCRDTDSDYLPNGDIYQSPPNADIPSCVRTGSLSKYGGYVMYGYGSGTTPPNGPNASVIPATGINFGSGGVGTITFSSDGSVSPQGSIYIQNDGISYCVRISTLVGGLNLWKWDGYSDDTTETNWTELR